MPDDRLPKVIFNLEYKHKNSWCRDLTSIFGQTNFMHIFDSKVIVDRSDVKVKLLEIFDSNFTNSLPLKPKLRNYALLKFSFEPEPYALKYLNRNKSQILHS